MVVVGIKEENLDREYWNRLDALTEKKVLVPKDKNAIITQVSDADCIAAQFASPIDKEVIDSGHKLKFIGLISTAHGTVDSEYAKKKGIVVSNVPGYGTESVSELVIASLLEHLWDLERAKKQVRQGNYLETGFSAAEIKGKIFGIIGLGRIGSRTAELALAFGADVRYWSRNRKTDLEKKGIKYEDLDTLIPKADFLSLHVVETQETANIMNEKRINNLKKGAVLIVTIPVKTVDLNALENRLRNEEISFITDHADEMKPEDVKRMVKFKNACFYPALACVTKEASVAKQKIFIENAESFLKGSPVNTV